MRCRARSVTDKEALAATNDLLIRIKGDATARTLVIEGAQRSRLARRRLGSRASR